MTKYLIILLIFIAIAGYIGFRYRRQLQIAWQVWKMLRGAHSHIKQQQQKQAPAAKEPQQVPAGKLVRCEKCGSWTPQDTALSFGPNDYFCSAKCMERAVS